LCRVCDMMLMLVCLIRLLYGSGYLLVQAATHIHNDFPKPRFCTETTPQTPNPAAARGAKTLWIGPPLMKAPKYSKKITYLDGLIADEVEKAQQHYQNTNRLFAKADGSYTAFLPDERGKPVAVRKGDGIHFTGPGEKILTQRILEHINP